MATEDRLSYIYDYVNKLTYSGKLQWYEIVTSYENKADR